MGKNNQDKRNGFSIVELLIVVGGLAGLALVSMNVAKMNTKSSVKFTQDSDIQSIINEMAAELSNNAKCLASIGGKNALNDTTVTNLNNKYFTVGAGGTAGYGNSNLKISSYAIVGVSDADVVTNNTSYLNIIFQNKNILAGESGPTTVTKKVKLYVVVDGTRNITDCRTIPGASSDVWVRGAGNVIYYSTGFVGVGTPTPTERLEVNGTLKTTDFQLTSDRKFKSQIKNLDSSVELSKILKLRPVSFTWKENGKKDQGFIAQEVKKEFPLLVEGKEAEGRGLAIKYFSVISSIVSSVQEMFHKQEALEEQVARQQEQIETLIKMNAEFQKQLDQK